MPFDATPVTSPVVEALREGRARVARGWCQYMGYVGESRCTMTALSPHDITVANAAASALAVAGGFEYSDDIVRWNDASERTQADVLALYDRAIDLAVAEAITNG